MRRGMLVIAATLVSVPASAQDVAIASAVYRERFDDGQGGGAFGRVVKGMDVVKMILASPTSPTKGEGVMKGQMLEPVVKITKASRVKE